METPNFCALCAELADALDHDRQCLMDDRSLTHPLADRARAALAVEAVGPSDDDILRELADIADENILVEHTNDVVIAGRRLLARARAALAEGEAGPSDEVAELAEWLRTQGVADFARRLYRRAADLLERHATPRPIPISERLPGPEDCDAEGRCWLGCPSSDVQDSYWVLRKAKHRRSWDTHWLPAHAIPLPQEDTDV